MNPQNLGKLVTFNAVLGVICEFLLVGLRLFKIEYNASADYLLILAMTMNFGLGLWNWKKHEKEVSI